ncbi:MAG: membrane protein insertase YidC [Alphaproteobacteria bacterium]|nr:membrane protein insertase YidC [Alphaproteobacteria bacterium]MDE2266983.1 membrane protein insertase YidC [Alphaproteobacteria bacterium]
MSDNRNLILAVGLSALVLMGWQYFVAAPQLKADQAHQALLHQQEKKQQAAGNAPASVAAPTASSGEPSHLTRAEALKRSGARIRIQTPTVDGSLRLVGARFDDLRLRKYHDTVDPKSPEIDLLAPTGTAYPYFAEFGWTAANAKIAVPDDKTPWQIKSGSVLAPGKPVTLIWDNGQGLIFTRTISVDDQYMFTVSDSVTNKSSEKTTLYPYALVVRDGVPKHQTYWVLHEGFVGVADDKLQDPTYADFKDAGTPPKTFSSTGGWLGITDKYWMAALIPPQDAKFDGAYRATPYGGDKSYQANYSLPGHVLEPGQSTTVTQRLFAGAKVVDTLRGYEHTLGIARFDYAVDWGWFIFITQPLFWLLDKFYRYLGNFGLAIILATVVIRLLLFPLANASFKSMSKMKKVQPEMERIKKLYADDQARQQQEMMELYKREKVNPLTGCLPMVVQIPILFSLYKVMFVTIEMYHAPFYGWIKDLSAPDPTSIINLFGLLPYHVPSFVPVFLSVGIWPILMGMTQWVQTKLNPAPGDPVQAKMFALMPVVMTFMFAAFPAGLVIYYTWNNLLSVTQQYVMMKRQGVPVHLFENLKPPAFIRRLVDRSKVQASE